MLALVLVGVGAVSLYANRLTTEFNEGRQTVESGIIPDHEPLEDGVLNILLLGSDSRGDAENSDEGGGERSDTMMLVHIPEDRESAYVMSIMRDLWVNIPGYGETKVNAALDYGGYPLVIDTVEELVGADIDHLAIVDFDGFRELTTALGGVEVENSIPFSSGQSNPAFYPEGTIRLEGTDALRFVRERKAFLDGDYQRVKNQQLFLTAIIRQLLNADTLTDPQKVNDVVSMFTPFITVDESLDASTIVDYGISLRDLRANNIEMFTIPNAGPGTTSGGASVIWQDENVMPRLQEAFRNDDLGAFLEAEGLLEDDEAEGAEAVPSAEASDDASAPSSEPSVGGAPESSGEDS
ncbi:LCP family glycopolymer transferase [Citricoccus sp. NR2]|uniref:LCP family glycopolymer transferase n=1 Tax=Citricoccus sp. NR2 TaxID=3004095 RepID=UPI0022DCF303|nr:LCP family protein [Citricoccus sp. NR2]WBL18569.1 LCP family protein [Citricoccus sp. NR2]